jgi:hypothetical protein
MDSRGAAAGESQKAAKPDPRIGWFAVASSSTAGQRSVRPANVLSFPLMSAAKPSGVDVKRVPVMALTKPIAMTRVATVT